MADIVSYALTNLTDCKETLGIASSDKSYDNLIIRNINRVTQQIEAYCGRRFAETTYSRELYNSQQINQLVLAQRPITSTTPFVFEVRDNGLNVETWETIDSELYFVDASAGVVDLMFNTIGRWKHWAVTYSAGYATIPFDLQEAAAALVSYYVLNPDGSQIGIRERQEGSRKIQYDTTQALSFDAIMQQLGIDETVKSYSNLPVLTDR